MTCPHCGAEVPAGNRFCNRCRKRVAPEAGPAAGAPASGGVPPRRPPSTSRPVARPASAASSFKRPTVLTILGVLNIVLRSYHSGATEDLEAVIAHVQENLPRYRVLALIGFSLGGNVTLKYLGERSEAVSPLIAGAVAFSAPCDLASGAREMAKGRNRIYMSRFIRLLHEKIRAKMALMPGRINDDGYDQVKTFFDFDDRYTAPLHGFKDAEDYWRRSSSKQFLPAVKVPTLMVSAKNDPFLGPECYPVSEASDHPMVHLEIPSWG